MSDSSYKVDTGANGVMCNICSNISVSVVSIKLEGEVYLDKTKPVFQDLEAGIWPSSLG